jgi:outer membrane protein OmpA-like peptidoglycan-associated protein
MSRFRQVLLLMGILIPFLSVLPVEAQTMAVSRPPFAADPAAAQATSSTPAETRPATTTIFGDTGLWYVPTGEILPSGKVSASAYRTNWDYRQGFSDISHFLGTVGVGVGNRAELFGSWRFDTRIDRDRNDPTFTSDAMTGGLVNDYPLVREDWTGNHLGEAWLGAKINLLAPWREQPAALALRGMVKLPTGDTDHGTTTGKADFSLDAIVSGEVGHAVELSGFGGAIWRGDPTEPVAIDVSNGFRWGVGAGFPSRAAVRITTELQGERRFSDTLTAGGALTANDGSLSRLTNDVDNFTMATLGVTFQHSKGLFLGAGLSYSWPTADPGKNKNFWGIQARLGYHPGVRIYVAPPPPPPPPPPTPVVEHNLTVQAACDPCTVEVGRTSTVTATAVDSINCSLTYRWTAPTGTFANATQVSTIWTAPNQEGSVPVTVTATCPSDNKTASSAVTIQVVRPAARTYTFEDVHFDFDRYSLRPDATRVLDEAITAMREDATLRLTIEGHTCSIGTAEYNMALGDRRANAVRDYLTSRGVGADRLNTISFGEEMPKYSNDREETRRLNRRAALVVRLQ